MSHRSRPAPPAQSIASRFEETATQFPGRAMLHIPRQTGLLYGSGEIALSYEQVREQTGEIRRQYAAAGLGPGDRVALLLENRPLFFAHFLALNGLGVSIVPIHQDLPAREIAWRVEHSEACIVVALVEHENLVGQACKLAGEHVPLAIAGRELPQIRAVREIGRRQTKDEAAILYTSGSTGTPKGCLLSNEYFLEMGRWYVEQGGFCSLAAAGERLMTPLPVSHMNALACSFMAMLVSGGCLVQLDRFHPSNWWQQVRESRVTIVHYLGVMPAILLKLETCPADDVSSQVKFGFGAGVDPRHQAQFEARFGFPLIEGWAMTETGSGACIAANREPRHVGRRCFGKAPPSVEYRIVDESGADCEPGTAGELLVRAAGEDPRRGFFSGYFKDSRATGEAWADGWFRTGDVVRRDAEGSMFFVDRSKNIVRRSGENIAAVEVEGALLALDAVRNCAVAPVADEIRGEEVMALIVLADDVEAGADTARTLFEAARDTLAYFKLPGYVAFTEALPLTSSEKLQRGVLKKLCADLVDAGKVHDMRSRKRRMQQL